MTEDEKYGIAVKLIGNGYLIHCTNAVFNEFGGHLTLHSGIRKGVERLDIVLAVYVGQNNLGHLGRQNGLKLAGFLGHIPRVGKERFPGGVLAIRHNAQDFIAIKRIAAVVKDFGHGLQAFFNAFVNHAGIVFDIGGGQIGGAFSPCREDRQSRQHTGKHQHR